jgi:gluconolactonase
MKEHPRSLALLVLVSLLLGRGATAAQDIIQHELVAKGARLEKLGGGYVFTEGPACDAHGNVYFTDQPNNQIVKWSAEDNSLSVFLKPAGRANGLCFDHSGMLLACSEEKNELWSISPEGKTQVLLKGYQGKRFNGPNDLWIAPNGSIYFTDPLYKRRWWNYPMPEQDDESVYVLSPDLRTLTRLTNDLVRPNGIIGTPDGRCLYVSDLPEDKTYRYRIGDDGQLYDKVLFCHLGSDGMTIDEKGNVYLTGVGGVTIFDKEGRLVLNLKNPDGKTGNVCFGGKDRKTLFITASTSVYGLRMNVPGVGSP